MNASSHADTTRIAPPALWRAARAFLLMLDALFGAPQDVARRHTLTHEPYVLLLSWLRCAEAMLRRLLLIEAAAYPRPNTRPLLHPKRKRVRKEMAFTADHPEAWRVSFRCLVERRHPRQRAADDDAKTPARTLALHGRVSREDRWSFERSKPEKFHSAWPLAERYEAVLRVFNDPAPYARRLARRLHATPHRAAELLRAPPEARHRIEAFAKITSAARTAWPTPNTS